MTFVCSICGMEKDEGERSVIHPDVCIDCDTTLVNDAHIEDGQLF